MAAPQTVHQIEQSRNSGIPPSKRQAAQPIQELSPRHGVVTLYGYGLSAQVDRGHLILKDGIGAMRRGARFARVRHMLRRLVVIGADGMISLSALRWLADQKASFVMLDRTGSVLVTTTPVSPSDARLRRAQGLAYQSGMALQIARRLIGQKLAGQEQVVFIKLRNEKIARIIASARASVAVADSIESIRVLEAQAGNAYWSAWHSLPVLFPKNELRRVPGHWRVFEARRSPLTGSSRLAVNPPNAILNYLYAVLESEARLAAAALGLDPGLGVMHFDTPKRDSLACDLMEPIRPQVDSYLLDWITRVPFRREWFFEERDGNCRLMAPFAVMLAETAPTWARAVAPIAEWVSRTLSSSIPKPSKRSWPATRLTQGHRREAKGQPAGLPAKPAPRPPKICHICGGPIAKRSRICLQCAREEKKESFIDIARLGQAATHSPKAEALRGHTQKRQRAMEKAWNLSEIPNWLDKDFYTEKVKPNLAKTRVSVIASALKVSIPYASSIRAGKRIPHPRHWMTLTRLSGVALKS